MARAVDSLPRSVTGDRAPAGAGPPATRAPRAPAACVPGRHARSPLVRALLLAAPLWPALVTLVLVTPVPLAAVSGCGGTIPESRYYVLEYEVEPAGSARPLDLILGVDVFAARPLYRDRRLAYRLSPHEVAYYSYRFWAADPGEMVAARLADQLRRRRLALAVLEQPFDTAPDWVVAGRIQRFEEVDRGGSWYAVLEMAIRIESFDGRRVLVEEIVRREMPTRSRTPEAVAEAMSRAVQELGVEVERLVRERAARTGR